MAIVKAFVLSLAIASVGADIDASPTSNSPTPSDSSPPINVPNRAPLRGLLPALPTKWPNPIGNLVDLGDKDWWLQKWQINKKFPDPTTDPFYTEAPPDLDDYGPGQVIRTRSAEIKKLTTILTNNFAGAEQIYYRSTDTHGRSQGGLATVLKPLIKNDRPGIMSNQGFVDAAAPNCCQSWGLIKFSNSTFWLNAVMPDVLLNVATLLQQGHYVVFPDFQGPNAAFAVGRQAGNAILDGIRATINHLNLPTDIPVVLNGYSGGAHATAWAADLAEVYAYELNVVAAAHGGTPLDMRSLILNLAGSPAAGLGIAGLVGQANAYDELDKFLQTEANEEGLSMVRNARTPGFCLGSLIKRYAKHDVFSVFKDGKEVLSKEPINGILKQESLLQRENEYVHAPRFPRFIFHAEDDDVIPINESNQFVFEQCQRGSEIWYRSLSDAGGHGGGLTKHLLHVRWLLKTALAGELPEFRCGEDFDFRTHQSEDEKKQDEDDVHQLEKYFGKLNPKESMHKEL